MDFPVYVLGEGEQREKDLHSYILFVSLKKTKEQNHCQATSDDPPRHYIQKASNKIKTWKASEGQKPRWEKLTTSLWGKKKWGKKTDTVARLQSKARKF